MTMDQENEREFWRKMNAGMREAAKRRTMPQDCQVQRTELENRERRKRAAHKMHEDGQIPRTTPATAGWVGPSTSQNFDAT